MVCADWIISLLANQALPLSSNIALHAVFCSLYDHMILNKKKKGSAEEKKQMKTLRIQKDLSFWSKLHAENYTFIFQNTLYCTLVLSMYLHITAEYKRPALSTPNEFVHHWNTYFCALWALWLSIPSSVAMRISVCGWLSNKTFLLWSLDCGALSLGALLISWLIPPPC